MAQLTTSTNLKPQMSPVKKFFRRFLLFLLLTGVLVMLIFWLYANFTYSEGWRAGMLLKFSKKGNVFKTYEGELNLGGINPMPGNTIANNIWDFSVKVDSIGKMLEGMEGKVIRVHYKEKKKNLPWQGDTRYFVDGVESVK